MKLAEAAKLYDELLQKAVDANTMTLCCRAIIEINKIASLPIPECTYGGIRGCVYYAWNSGHHNLELSINPFWSSAFMYRNYQKMGDYLFLPWRIGKEPVPNKIVDKFKLFDKLFVVEAHWKQIIADML